MWGHITTDKDIVYGPQVVLKKGQGKRTPDASLMRIQPEDNFLRELELIAIFEIKPGPCNLARWREGQESSQVLPPNSEPQWDSGEVDANTYFSQSYFQICEQASRALEQLPAHRSIPVFFLTGFYFGLIIFSRGTPVDQGPNTSVTAPRFGKGTEDEGYNALLGAHRAQLDAARRTTSLKYDVKYFRERYIDRQGHLTAEFAAALQLAIEGQNGPVLRESWFTALAKQGVANEENIVSHFMDFRSCQLIKLCIGERKYTYRERGAGCHCDV